MESSPFLQGDIARWYALSAVGHSRVFNKDQAIWRQGDPCRAVALVQTGRVHLSVCFQDGGELCLYVAGEGLLLGEDACSAGGVYSASAVASSQARVLLVERQAFLALLDRDPAVARAALENSARKLRRMEDQVGLLAFNGARYRVCHALLHLARQYGADVDQGRRLALKFTHQEMGSLTGLSRVSVNQILGRLQDLGVLGRVDGYYCILNWRALEQELES